MYSLDVAAVDLCSNNRPHFQTRYGVEARRYRKMDAAGDVGGIDL